jgi:hypothetical protein
MSIRPVETYSSASILIRAGSVMIEVKDIMNKKPMAINTNFIATIEPDFNIEHCVIRLKNDREITISESYESLMEKLGKNENTVSPWLGGNWTQ